MIRAKVLASVVVTAAVAAAWPYEIAASWPEAAAAKLSQLVKASGSTSAGQIKLTAVNTPADGASGSWFLRQEFGGVVIFEHADVTCMTVVENTAIIGLHFNAGTNPTRPVGARAFIWVQDNGESGDLWDAGGNVPPDFDMSTCPAPPQPSTPFPGDITVRP